MTRTGVVVVAGDGGDGRADWAALTRLLRWNRDEGFDRCTGTGAADDLEAAADPRGALPHRFESEMSAGFTRGLLLTRREAAAVVAHAEPHAILLVVHGDADLGGVAVADRVGD